MIERVFSSEAVLLGLVTGLSYVLAYYTQISYLQYYSIPPVFAEVTITAIIKAIVALAIFFAGSFLVWANIIHIVPLRVVGIANDLLLLYLPLGIYSLSVLGAVWFAGFTPFVLLLSILWIAFFSMELRGLILVVRRTKKWSSYVEEVVSENVAFGDKMLGPKIFTHPLSWATIVAATLLLLCVLGGQILGSKDAERKSLHSYFCNESGCFLIVSTYEGGVLASEISLGGGEYKLTGKAKLFSEEALSEQVMLSIDQQFERLLVKDDEERRRPWVGPRESLEIFKDWFGFL